MDTNLLINGSNVQNPDAGKFKKHKNFIGKFIDEYESEQVERKRFLKLVAGHYHKKYFFSTKISTDEIGLGGKLAEMYTRGCTPSTPVTRRVKTTRIPSLENAGVRPTTSHSLEDCVIKDSAHFKRKLNMKIAQIKAELFEMKEKIKGLNLDKKRIAYRTNEARLRAKELTEMQDLFSNHITALEKATARATISEIIEESAKLRETNDCIERELEDIYRKRLSNKQKVEELKIKLSCEISNTALRSVQQAVQNDPKKAEQAKMEVNLWELIQQRESLIDNTKGEYKEIPDETGIESDINLLCDMIGNSLNDVANSIQDVSKLELFESMISENHVHRVQNYAPRRMLSYLERYLSQLKTLDKYLTRTTEQFTAKSMDLKGMCFNSLNVSGLDDIVGRRMHDLKSEKSIIDCRRLTTSDKLNAKEAELWAIEKQLMDNECYKQQRQLENKLRDVNGTNRLIEEYLEEGRSLDDLHKCKERALNTIKRLNGKIISNLNQ